MFFIYFKKFILQYNLFGFSNIFNVKVSDIFPHFFLIKFSYWGFCCLVHSTVSSGYNITKLYFHVFLLFFILFIFFKLRSMLWGVQAAWATSRSWTARSCSPQRPPKLGFPSTASSSGKWAKPSLSPSWGCWTTWWVIPDLWLFSPTMHCVSCLLLQEVSD